MAAGVPKKLLHMAGVLDCYTSARGQTATLGNFGKLTWNSSFVLVSLVSLFDGSIMFSLQRKLLLLLYPARILT